MHREGIVDSKVAWMRTNKKMLLIKSNEWIYTLERQKICTLDLEPRALYNRAQYILKNLVKTQLHKEGSADSEVISPNSDRATQNFVKPQVH